MTGLLLPALAVSVLILAVAIIVGTMTTNRHTRAIAELAERITRLELDVRGRPPGRPDHH